MIHEADSLRFVWSGSWRSPGRFQGLLIYLLDSLHSDSPAALISVTALAAVWSAAKGMLGIEKGLNRVFGVTSPRNYILRRALCSIYTLASSLMCVTSLALLVFGSFLQEMLLKWFPALSYLSGMISLGRGLVMFIMLMIFFTAIYTALPHRRLSICGQIPGAMFSAAGWALTSLAFSCFISRYFGTYAVTYGSLTAVILFMLWLYVSICILFLGAEINWFLLFYKEKIMSIKKTDCPDQAVHFLITVDSFRIFIKRLPLLLRNHFFHFTTSM